MPAIRKLSMETPQILAAYANGRSLREIATMYEVSTGTVRNILSREGVVARGRGRAKGSKVVKGTIGQVANAVEEFVDTVEDFLTVGNE